MFPRIKRWLMLLGLMILALMVFAMVQRVMAVAAVQNAIERSYEITFDSDGRPQALPPALDRAAEAFFEYAFRETWGATNRHIIHRERFRSLFRGPIREIHVYYPTAFRGDLGAALARFPQLRNVTV